MKKLTLIAAASAALLSPMLSHAESAVNTTAIVGTVASAKLNLSVVIPSVLYLAVGTNTAFAANASIDNVSFTVPATNIGDSTVVAGVGGDQAAGAVTVRVFSNVGGTTGNVSLNSTTTGQMNDGAGNTIPWTQIGVASAALAATTPGFTNAAITHPTFNNAVAGGAGTATTLTAVGKIVRQEGKWTYTYANSAAYPAGTYGGTLAKNGQVTYTATAL
jgi:hypothetical protein